MVELLAVSDGEVFVVGAALDVAAADVGAADDVVGALDELAALLLDDPLVLPDPLDDVLPPLDDSVELLPTDPVLTSPLSFSVVSTCFCTAATWARISSGVASAPREGSAFSWASAALSLAMTSAEGCCESVTTI